MAMEKTWRWFGPHDPVSLQEARQAGATGIVTALHQIPVGEQWTVEEITKRQREIESAGLRWSVAESLPVHEGIKTHGAHWQELLENYKVSLRNLGRCGVDTVCYNFMPVLDWSRTDLHAAADDGSIASKFDPGAFAAFDLFILQREGAEAGYTEAELRSARDRAARLSGDQRDDLVQTVLLGFPGSGEAYTLAGLKSALARYRGLGEDELRDHLIRFLKEVVPVAEESGVRLAVHPDDPPRSLLGLPRVVRNQHDAACILQAHDSPSNGLTMCTGSFGAGAENNVEELTERFASRINFVHLRNVRKDGSGGFVETHHLAGDIDMYRMIRTLLTEQQRRMTEGRRDIRLPMRPDHGHLMAAERDRKDIYPGYSYLGRLRGLAELRGLEAGISRSLGPAGEGR